MKEQWKDDIENKLDGELIDVIVGKSGMSKSAVEELWGDDTARDAKLVEHTKKTYAQHVKREGNS